MLSGSGSMHFASSATVSWVMQWYILITHHSKFIKVVIITNLEQKQKSA